MSHFDCLGEIEVLVRRCSAKNVEDTNASTTSSAAESDLGEEEVQEADKTEDADESEEDADSGAKESAAQNDDEPLPFTALFDGPADYRRYSQSPGRETFGDWNWSPQPAPYQHHEGYSTGYGQPPVEPSHRPSYHAPSYPYSATSHIDHQHRPDPPPNYEYPSRPEKRVHFDHGQNQGPSADRNRYWDSHPASESHPRGSFPQHQAYQAQDLAESQQARYGEMPRHGSGHQAYHGGDGRPAPPHVHNYVPQAPSHFSGPTLQSQYSMHPQPQPSHHPHPSPAIPPSGSRAPPVQHWYPHPIYAVPQSTYPYHFHGYHSHYPPYAGIPVVPTASSGSVGDSANQKPGSLDPAKDENNPNGGAWSTQNDSTTNQDNSANAEDGWNTDNKDNENASNDSGNWEDDKNDGGQNDNSWDNNDNQGSGNDPAWDNNGGNENKNSNWDTPKQNDNAQSNWDNTDQSANGPNNGNDWDKKSTKATEGNAPVNAGPTERSLYGPYGTYYNVRRSGVPEPPCDAEEEPRYDVPQSYVDESGSRKQVQPGKGYRYYKKPCRLNYLDTLDEPYARFVFKYRTKEELKNDVGIEVDTEPSGNEEVQAFQEMEKDELIRMLLRAQGALGGKIPSPPPQAPDVASDTAFNGVAVDPLHEPFLSMIYLAIQPSKSMHLLSKEVFLVKEAMMLQNQRQTTTIPIRIKTIIPAMPKHGTMEAMTGRRAIAAMRKT